MSKQNIIQLVKLLNNDVLPTQLNYNFNPVFHYDVDKIQYNSYYKSFEFFESKFPSGFESMPGYYRIINEIRYNAKTPLDEMNDRINLSNSIDISNVRIS